MGIISSPSSINDRLFESKNIEHVNVIYYSKVRRSITKR